MRAWLILLVLFVTVGAHAQLRVWREVIPPDRPPSPQEIAAQKAAELADKQKYFIPKDPWRITREAISADGTKVYQVQTNYAKGKEWVQFHGEVTQILSDGITVHGWVGQPLDYEHGWSNATFTVKNFPYKVRPGIVLQPAGKFVARVHYIPNNEYSLDQLAHLDYGMPTAPPSSVPVNARSSKDGSPTVATK